MALSPLLARLKEATAALHREAECYVRILDRGATVDDYRRYLVAMHGFHAPIEQRFATHAGLACGGFAPETRCKAPWLRADLAALGASELPWCEAVPITETLAQAIGAAYVVEGSMLGGRVILARLPPALAPLRGKATRFLEGYGAGTGAQWRRFAELAHPADEAAAIAAACQTFERLIGWLATFEARGDLPLSEAS